MTSGQFDGKIFKSKSICFRTFNLGSQLVLWEVYRTYLDKEAKNKALDGTLTGDTIADREVDFLNQERWFDIEKRIKITRREWILIIIEVLLSIGLIISSRKFFEGNLQNIIVSIVAILVSIYLTITNRKQLYMPYFLISNNLFILSILGAGFNNANGSEPLIYKFRLIGLGLAFILFAANYKVYEKVYINK